METTAHISANILSHLLYAYGVRRVVVSPGSRNAPLIIALSRNHAFKITTVVDERCAAFVALGMASVRIEPVAIVCTSGTALLNYAPAVAEAYYRNVPLIVVSADRPLRWIDQNDSQTIRQYGVLDNIVRGSYDIPSDECMRDYGWMINRTINEALMTATGPTKGPVHINMHFDTPLGRTQELEPDSLYVRAIRTVKPTNVLQRQAVGNLAAELTGKKIAVLIGTNAPDARLNRALNFIAENPDVIVIAEAQSNVKGCGKVITNIDAILSSIGPDDERFDPEVLITVGGSVVSQQLKNRLRAVKNLKVWSVGAPLDKGLTDCFMNLEVCIDAEPSSFLKTLSNFLRKSDSKDTGFNRLWHEQFTEVNKLTEKYISSAQWCDFAAVYRIAEQLPPNVNIHVSNGMSIRYLQSCDFGKFHRVDCNRGCSGIDGCTSTAIGASVVSAVPTVLITGDMSFGYDIGALALNCKRADFTIFVLKNNGGEIFRIIETTRDLDNLEEYFAVGGSTLDYRLLAETYGFEYKLISSFDDVRHVCGAVCKERSKPLLVEVDTTSAANARIYHEYLKCLKTI